MGCSSCGHRQTPKTTDTPVVATAPAVDAVPESSIMAGRSSSNKLVNLRYKGGGMAAKRSGSGCRTCGGSRTRYQVVTTEQIMFVSEDAPNGIFRETFSVGHNYWVTEEQAKYLLEMTYKDMGGKIQHKFEEVK